MKSIFFTCLFFAFSICGFSQNENDHISISKTHPYYFVKNGRGWIPVSINYLPEGNFTLIEKYFKRFSENGGNSMRIWISTPFLEIEDSREGEYNPAKFKRIDSLLSLAKKYKVLIKFALQHVRTISAENLKNNNWANSRALASRFKNMQEYITSEAGRQSYLNRAKALSDRYNNNTQIYAWELWNEMDAVSEKDWYSFTASVLDSVKRLFPNHFVTQTLGSMHNKSSEGFYSKLAALPANDFLSIHRYLDEGDQWKQYEIVRGAVDLLAADAVKKGRSMPASKKVPVVINEIGGVEPDHAGPFRFYKKDKEGVLIHDMIFAPFFSGSAGSGSLWHWNHYIFPQNLWYHFGRFNSAVRGIDPVKEQFVPVQFENDSIRFYALKGINTTIIWCRDAKSDWRSEFENNIIPQNRTNTILDLKSPDDFASVKFYDPWKNTWTQATSLRGTKIKIPAFKRSVVILLEGKPSKN